MDSWVGVFFLQYIIKAKMCASNRQAIEVCLRLRDYEEVIVIYEYRQLIPLQFLFKRILKHFIWHVLLYALVLGFFQVLFFPYFFLCNCLHKLKGLLHIL